MSTTFKNAFEFKVIYVFTIDDQAHKGLVKIGDATLGDNIYINRTKEHILSTKKHFFLSLGRKFVRNQHSYASIRVKGTHMMTKSLSH